MSLMYHGDHPPAVLDVLKQCREGIPENRQQRLEQIERIKARLLQAADDLTAQGVSAGDTRSILEITKSLVNIQEFLRNGL